MALDTNLGVRISAETQGLEKIETEAKQAGDALEKAGKKGKQGFSELDAQLPPVLKNLQRINDQAGKIKSVGQDLTVGITAPIVAAIGLTAKAAIDFESSFAGIRKTVDASEEEFARIAKGMRDMAKQIPINVNELNRIGEAAGQLGIQNKNILSFTRVMADLGVATNLSSDQAADSLARFANITQMSQQDFDRLGSTIVDLGNKSAATESEIVEFGMRLAAAGSVVGLTEAEIMGMATTLASLGLNAEAGGTAFSKIMYKLATAVAVGGDELNQFAAISGMSAAQFKKSFEQDAISAIVAFTTGLGRIESQGGSVVATLEEMGLTEARLRDALLRTAGAGDLFIRNINTASTAWKENTALTIEAERRYATTASQLTILWNKIRDVGITLGNSLLPFIRSLIALADKALPVLEGFANWFGSLDGKAQGAILALAGFAAAIGPLMVVVGGAVQTISTFALAFPAVGTAVAGFAGALGLPLLGPIGLAVGALVGLGIAIVAVANNWDTLTTATFTWEQQVSTANQPTRDLMTTQDALRIALDDSADSFSRARAEMQLHREGLVETKAPTVSLSSATLQMTEEQKKLAQALRDGKGPLDAYFSSAVNWLKQLGGSSGSTGNGVIPPTFKKLVDEENLRKQQLKEIQAIYDWWAANDAAVAAKKEIDDMNKLLLAAAGGWSEVQKATSGANKALNEAGGATIPKAGDEADKASKKAKTLTDEIERLKVEIQKVGASDAEILKIEAASKLAAGEAKHLVDKWLELSLIKLERTSLDTLDELVKKTKDERVQLGLTGKALADYKAQTLEADLATKVLSAEGLEKAKKALAEYRFELMLVETKKTLTQHLRETQRLFVDPLMLTLNLVPPKVKERTEESLTAIQDFASNVASNINNTFADLIYRGLKGQFDDLSDILDSTLDAMLQSISQFAATALSNPIRLSLEAVLKGDSNGKGAGYQLGDITRGIGNALKKIPLVGKVFDKLGESLGKFAKALPVIGDIAAGILAFLPSILNMFKKTPRYAFSFESVKTEIGERAALVSEFLDPEFFANEIFEKIVARGGKGAFSGKEHRQLVEQIQKSIAGTIETLQSIFNKLPVELATQLNNALLNAAVDMETKIGRSNLLGFDAKGKKEIEQRLTAFFNGGLQARFLFAIDDVLTGAFEALGTLPEKAAAFIQQKFDAFANAESEEARAAIGQEVLDALNAYVDAFNIVEGNLADTSKAALSQVKALSQELGFEATPSLGELRAQLKTLIETADIDPSVIQKYVDLRQAIVGLVNDLASSIQSTISMIDSISSEFGLGLDTSGASQQLLDELTKFYKENVGSLSIEERQDLLEQIAGLNSAIAGSQIAKAQALAEASARKAQEGIQAQINQQNVLKEKIQSSYEARISALQKELDFVEAMSRLNEQLRSDARALMTSDASPLTGVEKLNRVNSTIASLESQLAMATTPEQQERIINEIRDAQNEALQIAGETFGVGSAQQIAIYKQTVDRINQLIALTDTQGRTSEQIQAQIEKLTQEQNAQIEAVDATIERLNAQLSSLGQVQIDATKAVSQEVRDSASFVAQELQKILDEQLGMLGELTGESAATLDTIQDVNEEMLVVQKEQLGVIKALTNAIITATGGDPNANPITGMAGGGIIAETIHGIGASGRSYAFGENGIEAVIPIRRLREMNSLFSRLGRTITGASSNGSLVGVSGGSLVTNRVADVIEVRLVDDTGELSEEAMRKLERQVKEGVIGDVIVKRVQKAHNAKAAA